MSKECPEEECFHWIPPGGSADMSRKTHKSLKEAFKKGEWVHFPYGGCSCTWGKCNRLHDDATEDFYEPCADGPLEDIED